MELLLAAESVKSGKAPGLDGIPPEVNKYVIKIKTTRMLQVLNELLKQQTFPNELKIAKTVIILKKKKIT